MKKIAVSVLIFLITLFVSISVLLYFQRTSRSTIFCGFLDDSIRPRNYCLMNPFREKQAEEVAEDILEKLRSGETNSLSPYLSHLNEDNKNHILEREKEFQVKNWRIGMREETTNDLALKYWTLRRNYEWEEEINFHFVRENDEWKLKYFGAIY